MSKHKWHKDDRPFKVVLIGDGKTISGIHIDQVLVDKYNEYSEVECYGQGNQYSIEEDRLYDTIENALNKAKEEINGRKP